MDQLVVHYHYMIADVVIVRNVLILIEDFQTFLGDAISHDDSGTTPSEIKEKYNLLLVYQSSHFVLFIL